MLKAVELFVICLKLRRPVRHTYSMNIEFMERRCLKFNSDITYFMGKILMKKSV